MRSADECFVEICKASRLMPTNNGLKYAASYARAGMGMQGESLRVQILYVQANLAAWRGELAKSVKDDLKAVMKILEKGNR